MNRPNVLSPHLIEAALRAPSSCPPLERLAAAAHGELPESELAAVLAHADSCPACAAELDLARSFAGELPGLESTGSVEGSDVAWVVDRLRAGAPHAAERELAPVVSLAARRAPASSWKNWAALAAALTAVGVGLALYQPRQAPPVPSLAGGDVVRGGRIELESELGSVAEVPSRIAWRAVPGAARYRLEIVGVDDALVVSLESAAPSIELAPADRSRLETFVRYRVRVSAFDLAGRSIAVSDAVELSVDPARR